jgi:DNA-binding MarR family transcriptional regulator
MTQTLDDDINLISEAMNAFVQAMSRPRFWERNVVNRAGVSIDRAGASLLHMLDQPEGAGCHLRDLAVGLGIEAPSVTRKVQQLERAGLVQRVADPQDKRAFVLKTTASGRQVMNRLHKAKVELFTEAMRGWSAADRRTFAQLLQRIATEIGRVSLTTHINNRRPIVRPVERTAR